jgi:hypothetical protein
VSHKILEKISKSDTQRWKGALGQKKRAEKDFSIAPKTFERFFNWSELRER